MIASRINYLHETPKDKKMPRKAEKSDSATSPHRQTIKAKNVKVGYSHNLFSLVQNQSCTLHKHISTTFVRQVWLHG